jgi:hypothetical protein
MATAIGAGKPAMDPAVLPIEKEKLGDTSW